MEKHAVDRATLRRCWSGCASCSIRGSCSSSSPSSTEIPVIAISGEYNGSAPAALIADGSLDKGNYKPQELFSRIVDLRQAYIGNSTCDGCHCNIAVTQMVPECAKFANGRKENSENPPMPSALLIREFSRIRHSGGRSVVHPRATGLQETGKMTPPFYTNQDY
jgi:hypothetical protein